jgi:uncharacterized protein (TIGR02996 family)
MSQRQVALLSRALDAADHAARLGALLEAWRDRPLARTAELIHVVSLRLDGARKRMKALSLAEAQEEWLAVAHARDPADLGWLLDTIATTRRVQTLARLRNIAARERDPRITRAFVALLRERPFSTRSYRGFASRLCRELEKRGDRSLVPALREAAEVPLETEHDREVAQRIRAVVATLERAPEPPTPTAAEERLLDELAAALGVHHAPGSTADQLLLRILAAPLDDGPRLVYADWLVEHGDARGELIGLQYARARGTLDKKGLRRERRSSATTRAAGWARSSPPSTSSPSASSAASFTPARSSGASSPPSPPS